MKTYNRPQSTSRNLNVAIKSHCGSIATLTHTRQVLVTWKPTGKHRQYTKAIAKHKSYSEVLNG